RTLPPQFFPNCASGLGFSTRSSERKERVVGTAGSERLSVPGHADRVLSFFATGGSVIELGGRRAAAKRSPVLSAAATRLRNGAGLVSLVASRVDCRHTLPGPFWGGCPAQTPARGRRKRMVMRRLSRCGGNETGGNGQPGTAVPGTRGR